MKERKKKWLQKNKCIELMGNFPPDLVHDASKAMFEVMMRKFYLQAKTILDLYHVCRKLVNFYSATTVLATDIIL